MLGELPEPRDTFENDVTTPTPVSQATEEATDLELPGGGSEESVEAPHSASQKNLRGKSLPLYYDVLCEPEDLQAAEQMFSDIEHNQRSSYQLTKQNIYHQIVLGNKYVVHRLVLLFSLMSSYADLQSLRCCWKHRHLIQTSSKMR